MAKPIRGNQRILIRTGAEWTADDAVVPLGWWAVSYTGSTLNKVAIGDGATAFSALDDQLGGGGGGGVSDGDKGDITVSSSGSTWTIDNDVVTYAKMQNVSAASRLLGRGDSGSGDVQEITLGSGLTMSGTTLSASGGGGGGGLTQAEVLSRAALI